MHVENVKDICIECNATYSRLNDMNVEDVEDDKNFRTMRKLSDLYSRIFQTQSSGCVSGLDHFTNFTNLKILNI